MARYIDEKDVYKLVEPMGTARVHCSQIDKLPRADVVPKSEVVDLLDDLIKEAREIASRYEKSAKEINDCDCSKIKHNGRKNGALIVLFKISEFKKKYMGETKHENESKA